MHELTSATPASLAVFVTRIEQTYTAWIDDALGRTQSAKTAAAYTLTFAGFRTALQTTGHDLADDPAIVATAVQGWAGLTHHPKHPPRQVAPATYNQRLAILSSFYAYGRASGLLPIENPIERIKRRPVQAYAGARPLDQDDVTRRLAAIDRSTIQGQRDYTLLCIGLITCRRAAELAGLRGRDVQIAGEVVALTWRRCKGGKVKYDTLTPTISRLLLAYLQRVYGPALDRLTPDAPIWVSTSRANPGAPISTQALADVCLKRLGTTKVHSLRHTGASAREDAGAKVSEIQDQLGHSSLATTGLYLKALTAGADRYGDAIAARFGLDT